MSALRRRALRGLHRVAGQRGQRGQNGGQADAAPPVGLFHERRLQEVAHAARQGGGTQGGLPHGSHHEDHHGQVRPGLSVRRRRQSSG